MISKLPKRSFHAFEIVPLELNKVLIQKGRVFSFGTGIMADLAVAGASGDIHYSALEPIFVPNSGTINILLEHESRENTNEVVNITGCRIDISGYPVVDVYKQTLVPIGSVYWNNNSAAVETFLHGSTTEQFLHGDVYCRMYGFGVPV